MKDYVSLSVSASRLTLRGTENESCYLTPSHFRRNITACSSAAGDSCKGNCGPRTCDLFFGISVVVTVIVNSCSLHFRHCCVFNTRTEENPPRKQHFKRMVICIVVKPSDSLCDQGIIDSVF